MEDSRSFGALHLAAAFSFNFSVLYLNEFICITIKQSMGRWGTVPVSVSVIKSQYRSITNIVIYIYCYRDIKFVIP